MSDYQNMCSVKFSKKKKTHKKRKLNKNPQTNFSFLLSILSKTQPSRKQIQHQLLKNYQIHFCFCFLTDFIDAMLFHLQYWKLTKLQMSSLFHIDFSQKPLIINNAQKMTVTFFFSWASFLFILNKFHCDSSVVKCLNNRSIRMWLNA